MSLTGTLARLLILTVLLVLAFPWGSRSGEKGSTALFPICQEEKWGFIDQTGKIIIFPKFDAVYDFKEGLAPVRKGHKWGYIDRSGKLVIPLQFEEVYGLAEGLILARMGKKWGFFDRTGKMLHPPRFDKIYRFSGKLARVEIGYEGGVVDRTGQIVFKLQGQDYCPLSFSEGLAMLSMGGKYGFLSPNGEIVIPPQFEDALDFSEGLAAVKLSGQWGFIDKTGKLIIPPKFIGAGYFSEELAPAKLGDKWGYIDRGGKMVIPPQFDGYNYLGAGKFSEGLAPVRVGGKYGVIDHQGKMVIPPQFDHVSEFSHGLAKVRIGKKHGLINPKGEPVTPLRFDKINNFSEALAAVKVGDKWGFIDQTGAMTIPPQFSLDKADEAVFGFAGGLARVGAGDRWGYIDRTGKFIWPPGQLQEPPSPPPGELQPSPIKPPQKKANLTYEDRQAWKKILQWPNHCSPDPADLGRPDAGLPHENPSGLRFWQLESKKYLVEVKCRVEPYNDLQLYLFYDETAAPPTSLLLQFERYDPGAKIIVGEPDTELSGYPEFHPQTRELTLWTRPPGLGEWDTWTKYRITEDKGVFLEVRAKAPDDNGKYKGIPQDPATYPIVVRPAMKAHLGKQDTYLDSGTVQGGELGADGLDLFSTSFAKHDTFERLVFDLHQWNMQGNPPAVKPSFFLVAYEQYPYRLVFEIEGIRMVNATFPNFAGSNYINNLHVAGSLGDSGVKYALTLKKPIEFEIYELHQPARIVVDIKGSKIKREKFPAVYSLRTQSLLLKSAISVQEILTGLYKESRILQSRNKKYLVEEGYYKTKQEALTRKKYLVKNLKELKEIDKGVILFIEKREVDEIPTVIHK